MDPDLRSHIVTNLHIFLKYVQQDKKPEFLKYVIYAYEEAEKDWHTRQIYAQNLGALTDHFGTETLKEYFVPMWLILCDDSVVSCAMIATAMIVKI